MSDENKEELKKCPFCYESVGIINGLVWIRCLSAWDWDFVMPLKQFNEAECWNEIDSLKSQLAEKDRLLQKAVELLNKSMNFCFEEAPDGILFNRHLGGEIEDVLEEIRSSVGGGK